MRNLRDARADVDYAAYLAQARPGTLEEAFDALDPRSDRSGTDSQCARSEPASTDHFAFYQDEGRWAWRRVNDAGTVVAAPNRSFKFYLQCVADARRHGWKGRPLSLFSMSGFPPFRSPGPHERR